MNKLKKTAKALNTVFLVIQKIVIIAAIVALSVMAVVTVAELINSDTVIGDGFNIVEIGPVNLELKESLVPSNLKMAVIGWVGAVTAAVFAVLTYLSLSSVRAILKPMTEGNPFTKDTSKHIKTLAWFSLAFGIVQNISDAAELFVTYKIFSLGDILLSDNVSGVGFNYTFETGFIILFFVLLLISYIFDYGYELQTLSDETL